MANTEAYESLNRAIDLLTDGVMPDGQIVTDAVLVVGCQGITDCGHRVGSIGVFLKDGVQPAWISRSLLREALDALAHEPCPEP